MGQSLDSFPYELLVSPDGDVFVHLSRPPTIDVLREIRRREIRDFTLANDRGYSWSDIEFIRAVPDLEGLRILFYGGPQLDLSPVTTLANLQVLAIEELDRYRLDLSGLSKLEDLSVMYSKNLTGFENLSRLKTLRMRNFRGDSAYFAQFKHLQNLEIITANCEHIRGFSDLTGLRRLAIYYFTKLRTIEGIEALQGLEDLTIEICKHFGDIEPVRTLKGLKRINFSNCGEIKSLKPIEDLKELEYVHFAESTNILDGDLSVLTRLPKLKEVFYMDRRHYSHKRNFFHPWKGQPEGKELEKLLLQAMAASLNRGDDMS